MRALYRDPADPVDSEHTLPVVYEAEATAMPSKTTPAITRDPETHSGAPVFTGTRIAVKILFDYLADGQSVDAFIKHYPSVSRNQAVAALEEVGHLLEVTA